MQLRQIPTSLSSAEITESSDSESEYEYIDSESSDSENSEEEFVCDIAILSSNTSSSGDAKAQEEENIYPVRNILTVEPYYPLDHCNIFESSSDSCPSPLTPPQETSPTKNVSSSDVIQVSSSIGRNRTGIERQNSVLTFPSTTNSNTAIRDRSPLSLKKPES